MLEEEEGVIGRMIAYLYVVARRKLVTRLAQLGIDAAAADAPTGSRYDFLFVSEGRNFSR